MRRLLGALRLRRRSLVVLALSLLALAVATVGLLTVRDQLDKAHLALVLLLWPLVGSAAGGRSVGLVLSAASFLVFNWFFLPPYHTFVVANRLDWLVLLAFLATGGVAAQLLYVAQEKARLAEERAAEVDRLRVVGAEASHAGRADEALHAVASVIADAAQADGCRVLAVSADDVHVVAAVAREPVAMSVNESERARRVAARNVAAVVRRDTNDWSELSMSRPAGSEVELLGSGQVRALFLPLVARERVVGVLVLSADDALALDAARWRFVDALSYYAALGVERVRLVAEAEHAEALREADQLKDALLASVSHDLRTPLTTIKARAHDLRIHGDERAEVIEQEADRLNRIVADLLDLSRLKAGALPTRVDLNAVDELLELVVQRVEGVVGRRSLAVRLSEDGELLFGRFDLAHSVRILVNLVENAHKYSPADSVIELAARRRVGRIEVTVEDRGPGLPVGATELAFEAFRRLPDLPADVGGAGLGLAIARRLAEVQSAELTYAPRPGGGSVFTLSFAAVDPSDDELAAEEPMSAVPRGPLPPQRA